ncbi:MAG: LptF/LptG family permease [Pseudomonadota bacterium]
MSALLSGPLPRYLRQLLALRVLAVLIALGGLLQILDLLDATTDIMARGQGIGGVGHYISLRAPTLLLQALPLAALIGAVFAFSTLAKQHEVIAMRAAGLPFRRVVLILLPTVLLIAAAQWLLAEVVVPKSQRALTSWWASLPSPSDETPDAELLWFKSGGVLIGVARAHPDGRLLEGVRIFRRDEGGHLVTRTLAARASYADRRWTLSDAAITDFATATTAPAVPLLAWETALRPSDVQRLSAAEPYVSGGLAAAVLTGENTGSKTPAFYRTRVQKAFADPAMALVMLLLATPVAVALTRGAKGAPMLVSLGTGLLFLLTHGLCSALGEAGLIEPLAAAWISPAAFGLLGLIFLLRLDRHQ